jgi:hypothetical protein
MGTSSTEASGNLLQCGCFAVTLDQQVVELIHVEKLEKDLGFAVKHAKSDGGVYASKRRYGPYHPALDLGMLKHVFTGVGSRIGAGPNTEGQHAITKRR